MERVQRVRDPSVLHSRPAAQGKAGLHQRADRQENVRHVRSVLYSRPAVQGRTDRQERADHRAIGRYARIMLRTEHATMKAKVLRSISQEATDRDLTVRREETDHRADVRSETEETDARREADVISAEARAHGRIGETHAEMI